MTGATLPVTQHKSISLGWSARLLLLGLAAVLLFLPHGVFLSISLAVLYLIVTLVWRRHQAGIIPFAFLLQWLQIVSYVLWMISLDKPMNFLSFNATSAFTLSLIGLSVMAVVINRCLANCRVPSMKELEANVARINEKKILVLYIISTVFLSSVGFIFGNTSGVAQVLVSVSSFKWIFLLWYGYVAWVKKKNRIILLYIAIYEFAIGFYSYFSTFKEVIFYILILSLTFTVKIKFRHIVNALLLTSALVALFLTWSAIKGDYRKYLNQGTRQQTVVVSKQEAYTKVADQVSNLTWKDINLTVNAALYRLQYIYHFSLAMDRVPALIPYQEGRVWRDNVMFVLTPRILFPDKGIYDPSIKASKYTGKQFAGQRQGAAFSLGYFADSYVDFGPVYMFVALIGVALFIGLIYRSFYKMEGLDFFLRLAIINVSLYVFIFFETDGTFLIGRLATNFLTFYILSKTMFRSIQRWVYQ